MSEVYLGAFRAGPGKDPVPLFPERLQPQVRIDELSPELKGRRVAAGFGWERYPMLATANADVIGEVSGVQHPRARFLLSTGEAALARGEVVSPGDLIPAYLRSKVAEKPATAGP